MTKEKVTASIIGLRQGSTVSQPSTPRPPRSRPAISTEAQMVNTVSKRRQRDQSAVKAECRNLNPAPTCGSANKMMHPDGHGHDQEQGEADPRHGIAV